MRNGATKSACGKGLCSPSAATPTHGASAYPTRSSRRTRYNQTRLRQRCAGHEYPLIDMSRNCVDVPRKTSASPVRSASPGHSRLQIPATLSIESAASNGLSSASCPSAENGARRAAYAGR
jgi:hypothetical protein